MSFAFSSFRFRVADNPFPARSFDVVFCSGVFNLNLGNNRAFLSSGMDRLMDIAREYLVFNLLHQRAANEVETYAHYDPDDVGKIVRRPGWDVRLVDDYLPNDFTLICRRTTND